VILSKIITKSEAFLFDKRHNDSGKAAYKNTFESKIKLAKVLIIIDNFKETMRIVFDDYLEQCNYKSITGTA